MTYLMQWFYTHYIKPEIENQPKDDGDSFTFSFLEPSLCPDQQEPYRAAVAYYSVQGFRLGLKTGLALARDLER